MESTRDCPTTSLVETVVCCHSSGCSLPAWFLPCSSCLSSVPGYTHITIEKNDSKNSLTSSLVSRRQRCRRCIHENVAFESLPGRRSTSAVALQPLAARGLRDAHGCVLGGRRAGLPRTEAREHWGEARRRERE